VRKHRGQRPQAKSRLGQRDDVLILNSSVDSAKFLGSEQAWYAVLVKKAHVTLD